MRKRAQSAILNVTDLDFCVTKFTCSDPSVHKALGLNTKECCWTVQCRSSAPLNIRCTFDKTVLGKTEVGITCNDQKIYPVGPSGEKSRLIEDFIQTWPFRGIAKGINEPYFVEVGIYAGGMQQWFPGTVLKQRPDGFFEVMASKQGYGGYWTNELYPFVNKRDLREAVSKRPYEASERHVVLRVPANDPLNNTQLTIDGGDDITRYFGRLTPNPKLHAASPKIVLSVTKDRSLVTGSVGHQQLMAYWNGEARSVEAIPKRPGKLVGYGSKMWKLQVGLSEHTIEVERRHKISKHITLIVDGELLIEALAEDIGCYDGNWAVQFRFVGDPVLEFDVNETDSNGYPLENIGRVEQRRPYSRVCFLNIQDMSNLSNALLYVDGVEFRDLPLRPNAHDTGNISISPTAMTSQYQITVPYKVNREATPAAFNMNSLFNFGNSMGNQGYAQTNNPNDPDYANQGGFMGILAWCCAPPAPERGVDAGRSEWQQQSPEGNMVYNHPTLDGNDQVRR